MSAEHHGTSRSASYHGMTLNREKNCSIIFVTVSSLKLFWCFGIFDTCFLLTMTCLTHLFSRFVSAAPLRLLPVAEIFNVQRHTHTQCGRICVCPTKEEMFFRFVLCGLDQGILRNTLNPCARCRLKVSVYVVIQHATTCCMKTNQSAARPSCP